MGTALRRVVLLCHYDEALRGTFLPLAEALGRDGRFEPVVIVHQDRDGRMARRCESAGVAWRPDPLDDPPEAGAAVGGAARRPAAPRPQSRGGEAEGGAASARLSWRRGLRLLRRRTAAVRREIEQSAALLRRLAPAVLVLPDDRTLLACRWTGAARRTRLPTVAIQWAATHDAATLAALRAAKAAADPPGGLPRGLERLVEALVPHAVRRVAGRSAWWTPPVETYAWWRCGAFPKANPWVLGGGNAEVLAVLGPAWRERLAADGVPPAKLAVTGHPPQDGWRELARRWTPRDRARVLAELGLPPDRPMVLLVSPALAFRRPGGVRRGDLTAEAILEDMRAVIRAVRRAAPGASVVVKAHPRDAAADLAGLRRPDDGGVAVVQAFSIDRLAAASDVVCCQWSTTAMLAQAVNRPVLLFNFRDAPSARLWRGVPGMAEVRDEHEAAVRIRAWLTDPAARNSWARERDEFVRRYLRLDGRATQRLVDLVGARPARGRRRRAA